MSEPEWRVRREQWAELAPLARRVLRADEAALVRVRRAGTRTTLFGHLPTKALVARAIPTADVDPSTGESRFDATFGARDFLDWLDGSRSAAPVRADAGWLSPLPPVEGWERVDDVPDAVVRDLVRQGAMAHVDAANLALGARAAENLLDTPVLTVNGGGQSVELTNRTLSALVSMGFLPRGGHVVIATARRWTRVAAPYGSVFVARGGGGLGLT